MLSRGMTFDAVSVLMQNAVIVAAMVGVRTVALCSGAIAVLSCRRANNYGIKNH